MKKLKHSDLREMISFALQTELGWHINSGALNIITSGIANFVYTFSLRNEKYYAKFFPDFFRNNELVAKPTGSFYRESWVYELALSSKYTGTPLLVHKSKISPLLITKEWGQTDLLDNIYSLPINEISEKITCILIAANKFRNFLSGRNYITELDGHFIAFSNLQEKYLILNPIVQMSLKQSEIDAFRKNYLSLDKMLVFGDLSLKNILTKGNEIRFCDFESIFIAPPIFDTCYLIADVLSKLDKHKHKEFILLLYNRFYPTLSNDEQKVFFRLLAICICYRNLSSMHNKSGISLDLYEIQAIFYM